MKLKFLLSNILLLLTFLLFAQSSDIRFRRISPPGGFSFQAIHSFEQDKFGYMWMGGLDNGVMRYDSKEIVRFVHNPENKEGLPSNTVTSIAIDKQNNIWVSTNEGLCIFNPLKQDFERVLYTYDNGSQASSNIFSIEFDGQGRLWIADEFFFGYLDQDKKKLYRITEGITSSPRLIYNDETNQLWLGSQNGTVFLVHPEEERVETKVEGPGSLVRTICTSPNNIWVGYQEHGARMYDLEGNLKTHYTYKENTEDDIESASIRKIWRDTQGQIWIGSYYGLFKSVGSELSHYDHATYDGLPHNSIFDIYEDNQGGIWIGTWSGGVSYIHHSDNTFSNYRHSKEPGALSDNMISSFAQTPNGALYVGTELFGLNRFEPLTSGFDQINIDEDLGVVDIKAMEVDKHGGLWVASAFNGLFYRPRNTSHFIHFSAGEEDGKHVSASEIYSLCKCDSGMWIGTNLGGINFYSFKTGKIQFKSNSAPFSSLLDQNCRSIFIDSYQNLWIATLQGAYKIHLPSDELTLFTSGSKEKHKTSSKTFYFITQLSDDRIWLGTGGGAINIYNHEADSISRFTADGLLNNKDVYGIIEGIENDVWITTNDGLILYNRIEKSARRFVLNDGIQGNLFNPNAIFKDKDNNLYFGGTNGFSRLEPKPIKTNNRPPVAFINSINVNNRVIVPVQTGINEYETIVLDPKETSISFQFTADNYLLSDKNEFSYRLDNYIDNWVYRTLNNSANFVNLPAGEYSFEVKASNNDGIWNEVPAKITIVIQQFWYKSTAAFIFYSLVALIIIILIIRFYRDRSRLKKALLIEQMEHQQEERLHEMKLKFFTNISHEFRTPLTLINGPIKSMLKADNLNEEQLKQLDTVKRNSNRLLQLINQIMDLRKAEKGLEKLNIEGIELVHFINDRIYHFSEEARTKNIVLSFDYQQSSHSIEADAEKLDKIIFNLLSNAFKYTPNDGKIVVTLSKRNNTATSTYANQLSFGELDKEDFIEISVSDNGQGIGGEDLPNVFDRFERGVSKTNVNSTGIGLNLCKDYTIMHRGAIMVQSTVGKGTRFSVQLPTRQKAQKIMYQSHEEVKNIESWEPAEKINLPSVSEEKATTILVVEDNKDLRAYIVKLLHTYYTVLQAENGRDGLEVLKSKNIDLVVSDVMMPQMDGFEFCQTLKSQIETSHIPVILLTALSSSDNTTMGLDKGADAYISKPFDEKILLSRINNLLTQRKRLQENFAQRFVGKQPIDVGSLDNYFLNKINSIVEDNFSNENFSVDALAEEMGLSRSQLHRKLKQISNHSSSEYINMVKIKKATTLLASKNYNVDEVAFKVGFNSHSYFSKCFKKIHGQTPKEFLKGLQ